MKALKDKNGVTVVAQEGCWPLGGEFEAKGSASPEKQVEYLKQCLQIAYDQVATLELEIKTLKAGQQLKDLQYERDLKAVHEMLTIKLDPDVRLAPGSISYIPPKRPWWKFWKERETRNQISRRAS